MALRNIVIISQDFPPLNTIAARRFGELSNYLEAVGYRPWIVTMASVGPLNRVIPAGQIIEAGIHPRSQPDKPFWYSDSSLYRNIFRFGFGSRSLEPNPFPWTRSVWKLRHKIRELNPECIIATYRPPSSLWIAKRLAKYLKTPWIADFRDLGAFRVDNRNRVTVFIDRMVEKYLVNSAAAIVTVSPTWQQMMKRIFKKTTFLVPNGYDFSVEVLNDTPDLNAPSLPSPYLHYAGQLYQQQMPSLELLMKVISQSKKRWNLVLRILGPANLARESEFLAKQLGIADQVLVLTQASPSQIRLESKQAAANIVFEHLNTSEEWTRGIILGKLPRLLPYPPPILAVAGKESDIRSILDDTQKGLLCSTESQIKEFLHLIDEDARRFSGHVDQISKYSRKHQAKCLGNALDEILCKPAH